MRLIRNLIYVGCQVYTAFKQRTKLVCEQQDENGAFYLSVIKSGQQQSSITTSNGSSLHGLQKAPGPGMRSISSQNANKRTRENT